jgi:hypothetical protein
MAPVLEPKLRQIAFSGFTINFNLRHYVLVWAREHGCPWDTVRRCKLYRPDPC